METTSNLPVYADTTDTSSVVDPNTSILIVYFTDLSAANEGIEDLLERNYPASTIGIAFRDEHDIDVMPPTDYEPHEVTMIVPHAPAGHHALPISVIPETGSNLNPQFTHTNHPIATDISNEVSTTHHDKKLNIIVAVAANDTTEAANILKEHGADVGDANRIRSDVSIMTGGAVVGALAGLAVGGPVGALVGGTLGGAIGAGSTTSPTPLN